ncbi:MAG: M20 family metallopeptidase [Candidatus Binatus sp.]|uniref:M20 family metallopeptidase n=1 Tax=Candidatus Binatus sp. TaxID=2811406 RepID=UPI0027221C62|nr:M20 family metallopeptidase [Candidatus Binatus sp.]MDO8433962.1 M20 family metallopeptidase [Candidatus Binatus sp.]
MDKASIRSHVEQLWDSSIVSELIEYIRIPNKSVAFDKEWMAHGHMERVVARFENWVRRQPIAGMKVEVARLEGRTPLLFIDIPGKSDDCVLLYGHMDKQPEMAGWRDGLGPWEPVLEGDRLYGRGAADDGYATFACMAAIGALQANSITHARCVVVIEACEESGSFDLPHYIEHLAARIGQPSLVIALDSGCGNYEQLWCTTSLRGLVGGRLTVEVLTEGMHSGDAGGVVPDSFRIVRQLLSRVEDEASGEVLAREFHVEIPAARLKQASATASVLGDDIYKKFPFAGATQPVSRDLTELVLNRTWRPALSIIGADGLPPTANSGNVLRPQTAVTLSLRLPPTCDPKIATQKLKSLLEENPPHDARVSFAPNWGASGWNAPELSPWLERSLDAASNDYFGKPTAYMGEGGTIPFMAMLGERFPEAQFLITGVLGPHANAHGPNEFLHIPTAKKLTCCVANVLADHFKRRGSGS